MVKNLLIALSLVTPALGVVVANYSDATNLRFDNDPSFIGNSHDWSGVGRVSATPDTGPFSHHREWATLIGDNYFISANHFKPTTGDTITFASGNSPGSPTFNYTVAGGFAVPGTDFWIGYTEAAMEASLKRYSMTTVAANNLADTGLAGNTLLMSGDHITGGPGTLSATVVGTNQAESFVNSGATSINTPEHTINFTPTDSASFDWLVTFQNLNSDTANTFTNHEAQVQSGDSGSPLFNVSGGELEIVGIAFSVFSEPIDGNFIDTPGGPGTPNDPLEARQGSIYSYPGSYETEINAAIALVPDPTPEPSTVMLLLLSTTSLFRRNRSALPRRFSIDA
ncbi:MAG: PEP-CTERM sorting domain-containing protein [Akkermansiaceae bacterium]